MTMSIQNKTIRSLGRRVKRRLSPGSYAFVQFLWWLFTFYIPRRIYGWTTQRKPILRGFGGENGASRLVELIGGVNLSVPTTMSRVMTWYGSDKGCFHHNYTVVYESLFKKLRTQPLRIFELGLGTNNEGVKSSMGVCGSPGASLRGWRDLFPNARVYGADIDRGILFEDERIKTFYCDQLDQRAIKELWAQRELQAGVDILIEDGLHTFEANLSFLQGSLDYVRPDGYYIVEDIKSRLTEKWLELLETSYSKKFPAYEFVFASLPNSFNAHDNNLLIIHKPVKKISSI